MLILLSSITYVGLLLLGYLLMFIEGSLIINTLMFIMFILVSNWPVLRKNCIVYEYIYPLLFVIIIGYINAGLGYEVGGSSSAYYYLSTWIAYIFYIYTRANERINDILV
ncbi:MAG: hypothetical protein RR646_01085 [Erysipelotrichaceae bacterium]